MSETVAELQIRGERNRQSKSQTDEDEGPDAEQTNST